MTRCAGLKILASNWVSHYWSIKSALNIICSSSKFSLSKRADLSVKHFLYGKLMNIMRKCFSCNWLFSRYYRWTQMFTQLLHNSILRTAVVEYQKHFFPYTINIILFILFYYLNDRKFYLRLLVL